MHPVCFHIGDYAVKWYGVMMAAGFLAGFFFMVRLGRREGRDAAFCSDMLLWLMIGGIAGARLAYVAAHLQSYLSEPVRILYVWEGGLIYYGGFVGAAVGLYVFTRTRHDRFLPVADLVAAAVPLGHMFGRLGCFLNGCCFGKVYKGWLAVRPELTSSIGWSQYYNGLIQNERVSYLMGRLARGSITETEFENTLSTLAQKGLIEQSQTMALPVHPVQLYEAGLNLILYLCLVWLFRRRKFDGSVMAAYFMGYAGVRLFTEFFRGDERMMLGGLTLAQMLSLVFFGIGLAAWIAACGHEKKEGNSNA
ncbi:MAG: prolipoprotein diacylglyceryl transferase [Kiritimatiellia bacterium]